LNAPLNQTVITANIGSETIIVIDTEKLRFDTM